MLADVVRICAGRHQHTWGRIIMAPMSDFGPDGEIYDDGNIYVPFPLEPEIDLFDPLDG